METEIQIDTKALHVQLKARANNGRIIMVGVPTDPDCSNVDERLNTLLNKWANRKDVFTCKEPSPFAAFGRNLIIGFARKVPEVTHILFLDADSIPTDDTLDRLVAADKDVITAAVPTITRGKIRWNVTAETQRAELIEYGSLPKDIFEITACGGACMLVKRRVFEKIEWPYFKDIFTPTRWATGQDVYFICKVRDAGFKVFCDPNIKCDHKKMFDLLRLAEAMRNSFGMNGWATHLPALTRCVAETSGPVLELGMGNYSTPILHEMCKGRELVSCDHELSWTNRFSQYDNGDHQVLFVEDWDKSDVFEKTWDVVLVDHNPPARRAVDILRLKARYIVVHDAEHFESALSKFKYRHDYNGMQPQTSVVSNEGEIENVTNKESDG